LHASALVAETSFMETRSPSNHHQFDASDAGQAHQSDAAVCTPRSAVPPAEYSIAAVSKLTGISCHTLRVWERRYGFPVPGRSASGHRRYDRGQVQMLCRLTHLSRDHRQSISELITSFQTGSLDLGQVQPAANDVLGENANAQLINLLITGDAKGAEVEFEKLAYRLDPSSVVDQVIYPTLVEAGEGWFRHIYSVYEERLITVFLRRKLSDLIEAARRANSNPARCMIAGTVQGDRHEGGLLIFHHAMELRGWRVHNLGVDLPVREFEAAIGRLCPSALALSFVLSRNVKKRFQELEAVRTIPVFVGGRSIINYQSLARTHGLIPVPGPIARAAEQLEIEFDLWCRSHATTA
jgi:DNA-binding transcriptional MerR regulator